MKIDVVVMKEAERLAAAARVPRDEYIIHALRHYNRLHARTKRERVRPMNEHHVIELFPVRTAAPARPAPRQSRSRRRS